MCRASGVSAEILADRVPAIDDEVFELIARGCIPGGSRDNLKTANKIVDWRRIPQSRRVLLTDAQTSGGLLLSVAPSRLTKALALLKHHRTASAAIIGKIIPAREPLLCISE
jgi:selenide,water dikinase